MVTRPVNRTERLAAIERMLFRSELGLRAVELAEMCGVDRRTIYRDIALLTDIGVPIFQKDGRFCIDYEHYLANVRLSQNEVLALFLAVRVMSLNADQQNPHLVAAFRKLGMALPETIAAHLSYLTEFQDGPVDPGLVTILETVARAWKERRKVKLWCASAGGQGTTTREFAVYFIEPTPEGEIFIIGYDSLSHRIRPLRLGRMKRAKLLRAAYEIPAHFKPAHHMSSAWGILENDDDNRYRIDLLFASSVAAYIRSRTWHASQQIETLEDGRCILTVHVPDWAPLIPWIRSWGPDVEVLTPGELRDVLVQDSERVLALYNVGGVMKQASHSY